MAPAFPPGRTAENLSRAQAQCSALSRWLNPWDDFLDFDAPGLPGGKLGWAIVARIQGQFESLEMTSAGQQGPRAEPPPLVDAVVRFLVWTGIVSSLAAPVIGMLLIWYGGFFAPWGMSRELSFDELQRRLIEARSWVGGVVAGGDARTLARDANRLRELTAYDGEAKAVARTLEVVVVRFSKSERPDPSPSAPQRIGYRDVRLDLTGADRTAALIIADAPVLWSVEPNARAPRAKLTFEGTAPFDVANGFPAMLAGFRIESFAAHDTTRPQDALGDDTTGVGRYCRALTLWAKHFGLTLADTTATFIDSPSMIRVSDRGVRHDGRELTGRTPFATCPMKLKLR